ncbi:MAG: glycosyltransferase [bacterium]|nr:glycosyltransferase [bacterium]
MQKIAAIVPAFNEEHTVHHVVSVLARHPRILEVIVVDDGSEDRTAQQARAAGARVLSLLKNQGKGEALSQGINLTKAPLLMFVDADLFTLSHDHVSAIISLLERRDADMAVGAVDRGILLNAIARFSGAPISGFRILKRDIWDAANKEALQGYLVEGVLTVTARRMKKTVVAISLKNLRHISKPKKRGLVKGIALWLGMWKEIIYNIGNLFS